MEKEYVPYEQALALKELGFDGSYFNMFYTKPKSKMVGIDEKGRPYPLKNTPKKLYIMGEAFVLNDYNAIVAPLYQQVFRWFREKYDLHKHICHFEDTKVWHGDIYRISELELMNEPMELSNYTTYEEAELACLKKLIEIIKNKNNG